VPTHAEDYVHRIGRTGRAGEERLSSPERAPQAVKAPSAPPGEGRRAKQGGRRRERDDAEPVVGLGDHVPDFLLRRTRVSSE
jgi:superfamily II DNA/RNA helicase